MLNLRVVVPSWCMLLFCLFVVGPLQSAYSQSYSYAPSASQENDATQSVYVPYTPTVSPVGSVYAPSLATTAGNTPYAYSPSAATGSVYGSDGSGTIGISGPRLYGFDGGFGKDGDDPNQSKHNQNPNPVGEAWFLLFLAAGYLLFCAVRRVRNDSQKKPDRCGN